MMEAINPVVTAINPAFADRTAAAANQPAAIGFGEMMAQLASSTIAKIEQAEKTSIAKISGVEIPLREVVDQVMAANQALNTTLAIRDKIVQAYIEISHTQI